MTYNLQPTPIKVKFTFRQEKCIGGEYSLLLNYIISL